MEMETETEMGNGDGGCTFLHQQASRPVPCLPVSYLPCHDLCSVLVANCTHEHVENWIHYALHQPASQPPQAQACLSSSRCC